MSVLTQYAEQDVTYLSHHIDQQKVYIVRKEIKGTVLVQLDLSAYFWNGDYSKEKESSSKAIQKKKKKLYKKGEVY